MTTSTFARIAFAAVIASGLTLSFNASALPQGF